MSIEPLLSPIVVDSVVQLSRLVEDSKKSCTSERSEWELKLIWNCPAETWVVKATPASKGLVPSANSRRLLIWSPSGSSFGPPAPSPAVQVAKSWVGRAFDPGVGAEAVQELEKFPKWSGSVRCSELPPPLAATGHPLAEK